MRIGMPVKTDIKIASERKTEKAEQKDLLLPTIITPQKNLQ